MMARSAAVLVLSFLLATSAEAASVTNKDASAVVLTITESGNRVEMMVDAGASKSFCPSGCFLTAPDGDRIGLEGGEAIDIVKGSAIVK
jgi:predicted porin